jgi:hypothetical protein
MWFLKLVRKRIASRERTAGSLPCLQPQPPHMLPPCHEAPSHFVSCHRIHLILTSASSNNNQLPDRSITGSTPWIVARVNGFPSYSWREDIPSRCEPSYAFNSCTAFDLSTLSMQTRPCSIAAAKTDPRYPVRVSGHWFHDNGHLSTAVLLPNLAFAVTAVQHYFVRIMLFSKTTSKSSLID